MTGRQPVTLTSLTSQWGDLYLILLRPGPVGGAAPRRHRFLTADTLGGLESGDRGR